MFHKVLRIILFCLVIFVAIYGYYYNRWQHLWTVTSLKHYYPVTKVHDDTLRVIMIGDSWTGIHSELGMDAFLESQLGNLLMCPVKVWSKGKGGEKSRGIYKLMFQMEGYGTRPLFLHGADYCIISAGINDAAANLGMKQFVAHYKMILDFLLVNHIRPVIIEIPDVDIWNTHGNKGKKDLLSDFVKSTMTGCRMYHFHEYREALLEMLHDSNLMQHVLYVPMTLWNGEGVEINPSLFVEDKIHLNRRGYERLDSSIATAIVRDLQQTEHSALVNQPMCQDAEN